MDYYVYRYDGEVLTVKKYIMTPNRNWTARHRLPVPTDPTLTRNQCLIFACILHCLRDEREARSVTVPIAAEFPNKLGSGKWTITLDDLRAAYLCAFCIPNRLSHDIEGDSDQRV